MDHDGDDHRIYRTDLCTGYQLICLGGNKMVVKVILGTMQNAKKLVNIAVSPVMWNFAAEDMW